MIIKNVVRGIGLVFVMMGFVLMVMAAPSSITDLRNTTYAHDYITWTWTDPSDSNFSHVMIYLDGVYKENVSEGIKSYNATNLTADTSYTISTRTVDDNYSVNSIWENLTARTALPDTTPPASITNLQNTTCASTYINWTWTDPGDADFSRVIVYLNDTPQADVLKGVEFLSTTGLTPDTDYTISTQTIDTNGNINSTWENRTARTALPDTTPPASITNLQNTTYASTYINWTWTDPGDADFSRVIVYLNDTPQADVLKEVEFLSTTGLTPDTDYTISTQTIDTNGNINSTWENRTARTALPDTTPPSDITNLTNISGPTWIKWTWTNPTGDFDHTEIYFDDSFVMNTTTNNYNTSNTTLEVRTTHNISLRPVDEVGNVGNWANHTANTVPNPPTIEKVDPSESSFETIGISTKTFTIKVVDQTVNVTWTEAKLQTDSNMLPGSLVNLTFTPSSIGTYYINVSASNENGTSNSISWTWTVRPKTYASGNRIWDGGKDMSTTYTWSPMSFYAFYYDVDDNVGNETLQIRLNSKTDRTVPADRLIYSTVPEEVKFKYNAWGSYKVIGFMADKYFAGYTSSTNITDVDPVSTLNYKQLHKVLMDDKDAHTLRASTTYPLGDGYALNLKDIGAGRVAMISITKDGGEVDNAIVDVGETYTFSKKVGSINDLPIIILHIRTVFMGTTDNMVQIDGIFQISESYTSVNQNNNYGMMEIRTVGDSGITMKNENSFTLSSGSTIDIMGDMKFIVANNDSVLRFAPMVKKTGEYEVRGTISNNETPSEWTPLSFEGFYYNIDEDIGTEKLTITRSSDTSRSVGIDNVVYSTSSAQVPHEYSALGKYDVIGFMAEKYFAGYEVGLISDKVISTMGKNQLHKVLIDDDTQRVIYAGSTLTLNDGYVIKIKYVYMGAGSAEVWLSVLKDGNEVGYGTKGNGKVFTFQKDVGAVKDLPIIALRIQNIFRGKEATAAFVKGTFQISESYKTVKQGDNFDRMEVNSVSADTITMKNPSVVSLDAGSSDTLMGNMRLKVADSTDIRYYPYILVNGSALAANQLAINVPSTMMVKDVISISVTSGSGANADNAEVSFDGQVIGTTNSTGKLDYMLTKAGTHNFTATKLGYEAATQTVKIDEYVDNRLSFELPEFIDQYIPVSIIVKVSGTGNATSGADITFDGTSIGKTDSSGTLTYTFTSSGTHNIAASKPGYITVQREINVRLPFTEFKALDINFRPDVVNKGQNVYVWANITNTGTKEGMLPVALIINSTVVENSNVTIAPGKNGEVNFSHKIELPPGNYSVEILGQKTTMPVKDEPLNLFLIAGIITIIGAVSIFVLTSNNIISIEALKAKLNMGPATNKPVINTDAINRAMEDIMSKFKNIMSKFKKK